MSDGLTAFERRRAANAKANNEILSSISKTSAKVFAKAAPKPKAATAPRTRRTRAEPVKRETPVPTRRSARVAGVDADTKRKLDDDDALKYGLGESAAQEQRAKKVRVEGDLSMADMQLDGRWSGRLDLGTLKVPVQPGVRTFLRDEDEKDDGKDEFSTVRRELATLRLYDTFPVADLKLTKDRVYALAFHPTEDKPLVLAGDKEGRMGIFDASQTVPERTDDDDATAPEIVGFKPHARTVSGVHVPDDDPASVYTCSYDTTIRRFDLHAQTSVEVYAPDADDADDAGDAAISCMDWLDPHTVFFSTLGGALGRHDTRTPAADATVWRALHGGHKIGGFSLCPQPGRGHFVATASLDRTLRIWDVRRIESSKSSESTESTDVPFLVGSDPARLSVSHAAWGPAGHIATTSYDDTVRVYDMASQLPATVGTTIDAFTPVKLSHNCQTGRWVTILKPQWQRRPAGLPLFTIGNMNRFVDIYAASGGAAEQVAQLDGDGITAVPAVAHLHPTQRWVAGGNASGKLTLWL